MYASLAPSPEYPLANSRNQGPSATLVRWFWWLVSCCGLLVRHRWIEIGQKSVRVVKPIAEGGFSFVYLVEDSNGTKFALKKCLCQTAEQRNHAQNEISVLHALKDSAFCIPLIDAATIPNVSQPGTHFVCMLFPLLGRGTLTSVVGEIRARDEFLPEKQVLTLFSRICQAVNALHSHKPAWAHFDIKLDNVLLDEHDHPFLMDFGSVAPARTRINSRQDASRLSEWAATNCTSSYRAPELFDPPSRNAIVDERVDVWSLGCVLFGIAFGLSPFEGADSPALAAVSGRFTPPDGHPYSDEFMALIGWTINTEAAKRPFVPELLSRIDTLLHPLSFRPPT